MSRYKVTLAYDGTAYVGWQRQPSGPSVQGVLEAAVRELAGRDVDVVAAGRTDAGVHARGQVVSFDLDRDMSGVALAHALNAHLPPDIRVLAAAIGSPSFHARFDARAKSYRYRIWNAEPLPPFERLYAWHLVGPIDVGAMDAAARLFEGAHDFTAFQGAGSSTYTAQRELFSSRVTRVTEEPALVVYDVTGTGFLRHMVRSLVGTLVDVGRGRRRPEAAGELLRSLDRASAGRTAPPQGLFLMRVDYDVPGGRSTESVLADES